MIISDVFRNKQRKDIVERSYEGKVITGSCSLKMYSQVGVAEEALVVEKPRETIIPRPRNNPLIICYTFFLSHLPLTSLLAIINCLSAKVKREILSK